MGMCLSRTEHVAHKEKTGEMNEYLGNDEDFWENAILRKKKKGLSFT